MRRWFIGVNDIYYTSYVDLEEAPWYIFAIDNAIMVICDIIPGISLPRIKIKWDGEDTNLREWYGDTQQVFHAFVCDPIFQWCQRRIKSEFVSLPFFFLKNMFPEEFKDCDYEDSVKGRKLHSELVSQVLDDLMKNEAKDVTEAIKKFVKSP